jgi:hypothetical protein
MHRIFLARAKKEKNGCIKCGRRITSSFYQKKNRKYVCLCLMNVSVTAGTPMHRTYISLETWFSLIQDVIRSEEGIDIRYVRDKYNLSHEASWNILYRIRGWINLAEESENCKIQSRFVKVPDGLSMKFVLQYSQAIPSKTIEKSMLSVLPPLFEHLREIKNAA